MCCVVLCCAVLCCVVLCCVVLCRVVLCCVVLCCVVLCCVVLCCVVLCCVVLCCVVLCCVVLCCVVLCYAVVFGVLRFRDFVPSALAKSLLQRMWGDMFAAHCGALAARLAELNAVLLLEGVDTDADPYHPVVDEQFDGCLVAFGMQRNDLPLEVQLPWYACVVPR